MGSIIVVMSKDDMNQKVHTILRNSGSGHDINICETSAEVLRLANDRDYGVVICQKFIKDMSYEELARFLPNSFGMVIITKDASLEVTNSDMIKLLVPFKSGDLISTVDMVIENIYRRFRKKQKVPLQRNVEDKKTVDQAKHILMDRNGLSEEEAFRYIQKNSMDQGRKMVETAQMILALYD